jgi:lysophospholipase L1-like esterase
MTIMHNPLFAGIAAALLAAGIATAQIQTLPETTKSGATMPKTDGTLKGVHRINFCGDSLTDGSAWTDWIIETLHANGYPDVVKQDAGVAGDNVPKLKARFQHDVLDLKPDMVIMNIGTNDREPVGEYRTNVEEMVKSVRLSGAKMLLVIPPGINDAKKPERDAAVVAYGEVLRDLAKQYDCTLVDLHAAFAGGTKSASAAEQSAVSARQVSPEDAAKYAHILWGPDGVHHTKNGWRTMARTILDALGCSSPVIEKVSLEPHMLTDWYVGPTNEWKSGTPYPPLPELPAKFDPAAATGWQKFDRESNMAKTSWWQESWVARGGIMPLGQELVKDHPGAGGNNIGAYSLAVVPSDKDTQTTLHLGGSTGYAVWVNGELVWECKALHGYHPDADRVTIKLHKGENHILVFSNWLFYAQLGDF